MDLSAHTSLTPLAEAVAAVLSAAAAAPHEIYIAGALARDLWLEFAYAINTGRRTEDIDFAVECADWDAFAQLRATLLAAGDVVPGDDSRHPQPRPLLAATVGPAGTMCRLRYVHSKVLPERYGYISIILTIYQTTV